MIQMSAVHSLISCFFKTHYHHHRRRRHSHHHPPTLRPLPTKFSEQNLILLTSTTQATCSAHSIPLDLPRYAIFSSSLLLPPYTVADSAGVSIHRDTQKPACRENQTELQEIPAPFIGNDERYDMNEITTSYSTTHNWH
jgi:hypothetical protein